MEEVATKAKEAVTANGHADEPTKAEPTDDTGASTEQPVAEPASESAAEPVTEPVAEKAAQVEPVEAETPIKAETPVPEGESSTMELQTPHFQGEAVR